MRDPRLDQLAEVLVRHCAKVRPGDLVTIVSEPAGLDGVEAVFEAVLRAGAHPSFHPRSGRLAEIMLRQGSAEQIEHICLFEQFRLQRCDVLMVLLQPVNTRATGGVAAERLAMSQRARRELMAMSMARAAAGEMRYVLSEIPTAAAAQEAEMSLSQYEDWVYRAGMLDRPDPVAAWQELDQQHKRAIQWLGGRRALRFVSPPRDGSGGRSDHDGTDLTVDVTGGTWISCAGGENFPDGEIFTGPAGADGVVNFTYPAVFRGKEVRGIRLRFAGGRVADASATHNEDHLLTLLDSDQGARVMGEIAIGTNYGLTDFIRNTFFDEKIGGTFHLALGAGYPESGNSNQSGLHWDMVSDLRPGGTFPGSPGGEIFADGELFHRDGRFIHAGMPGA